MPVPACFPTIQHDRPSAKKNPRKKQNQVMIITPIWVTWCPLLLQMSVTQPIMIPCRKDLPRNPKGEYHPPMSNRSLEVAAWMVSGGGGYQRGPHHFGGTKSNYGSTWKKFGSWCDQREIDRFCCALKEIFDFLGLFLQDLKYRTIGYIDLPYQHIIPA